MLIGEYHHNLDDKNRLIIPAKFREEIGNKFIVTKGLDGCLYVYSQDAWNNIILNLKKLSFTKKDARTFIRFFLSSATVCEFDKQGRISLVNTLIDYANIKKECTIIGVDDRLEIWALEEFNKFIEENIDTIDSIAENLFGDNYA